MYIYHRKIFENLDKKNSVKKKIDKSLVTTHDYEIQKLLKKEIKNKYPEVKQFLMEENFDIKNFKKIDFKKPLAIIDPIDGTENYLAKNGLFGSVFSIISKKKEINSIYIPNEKVFINNNNIYKISMRPKNFNKIVLASTKCVKKFKKYNPNIRVFGSASYMFYLFITGKCKEYIYCDGAKLWDCYTGLRLCSKLNCQITIENSNIKNWLLKPTFLTSFRIKWY